MSKLPAPNYTQGPNVLFDEIFKTLKEGELRIVLVLIRQTFGWHKTFDRISLNQLADKSGMQRRSVSRSLESLIEKKLVEKKKFGESGRERCYFSLVVEEPPKDLPLEDDEISEEELELLSNNSYQCPLDTTPRCPTVTTPGVPVTPTKETSSKESFQKKQQSDPSDRVIISSEPIDFGELELEDYLKIKISKKFTHSQIKLAVKRAQNWKNRPNDGIAIMTCLNRENEWNDNLCLEELEMKNYYFLSQLKHFDSQKIGEINIIVGNREIQFASSMKVEVFSIESKDFISSVIEYMKKVKDYALNNGFNFSLDLIEKKLQLTPTANT